MKAAAPSVADLWAAARTVLDPEVPALSVVDLGIVREIRVAGGDVEIDVTPTYSGCPAMRVIETELRAAMEHSGATHVNVITVFQPAWTTDWISADARERLRAYGIAPPSPRVSDEGEELIPLRRRAEVVACPYCGSRETALRSEFGATACKSIHYCNGCQQPFEHFKAL